jgi:hypothetical protein
VCLRAAAHVGDIANGGRMSKKGENAGCCWRFVGGVSDAVCRGSAAAGRTRTCPHCQAGAAAGMIVG